MAALRFVFITLPCLAVVGFTCFAAFRARKHEIFKVSAHTCLYFGLTCALVPVGAVVWISSLRARDRVPPTG
ncbi:hypothetical protein ACFXAE_20855 [Streptomyces sp. NPDC059454]|uniref:hypothetical protein n=1 Tax=Streptomyces sp. NPDC059454 TaxID=3346836 RepID=UPI0036CBB98D